MAPVSMGATCGVRKSQAVTMGKLYEYPANMTPVRVIHSYVVNDKLDILLHFQPDSESFGK